MNTTSELLPFLARGALVAGHRPWSRFRLNRMQWGEFVTALGQHDDWALLGLWAEPHEVHAAIYEDSTKTVAVASLECVGESFPTLSRVRPSAIRLERTIQDLTGLQAEGLEDTRPWFDHGQFPLVHPLANMPLPPQPRPASAYPTLRAEGHGIHQIPVGPVHAGIIEPGHFRFSANGEAVVRLEARLGYVHKGVEKQMQGLESADAAKIAARISGDSTVAHSLAFARAVEAALDVKVPGRAQWLRGIMAELERVANHLGDVGAICNDAAFSFMLGQCGILREKVLAAAATCFGHRLMMDRVVPGGVAVDLNVTGVEFLHRLTKELRDQFAPLMTIYEDKSSLLDRTMTTGIVSAALVHRFAAGGFVGRASARGFDARRALPYAPYAGLDFEVPVLSRGDVHARLMIRSQEIFISLDLIDQMLRHLPAGELMIPLPTAAGEGMALVEAFRGDILTWVRLDAGGRIARCHPRDASWFQWPLLEVCVEGNIVADFPLCNKSFNCSYSGHDL